MKKTKTANWLRGVFFTVFMIGIPGIIQADVNEVLLKFQPYISLQEEYTNNINLTPNSRKDDYVTTVNTGFRYSTLPQSEMTGQFGATSSTLPQFGRTGQFGSTPTTAGEKYGVDLNANVGFVYYAAGKAQNYLSLAGGLDTWYTWSNRLNVRVNEYIVRSDDSREAEFPGASPPVYISGTFIDLTGLYLAGTQRQRAIYLRNVFTPSVEYKFSKDGLIGLSYISNIYNNQSSLSQNSRGDTITPMVSYWFDIRNGVSLQYSYRIGNFDSSSDFTGHMANGQYMHRFSPQTSIFLGYRFSKMNFDSPGVDYYVNSPSLGVEHRFGPNLSGKAQVGYFWQSSETGKGTNGPTANIILTQRDRKTTYTLLFQGGYQESFFTAENLGFIQYYRGMATVAYQLREKTTATLSGSLEWDKSKLGQTGTLGALTDSNRKDTIWTINGNVSHHLLTWLTLSLNLSYRDDHSNISSTDYKEFRSLIRVEARYL